MKTNRFLLLAVSVSLAMSFTISCSDDKSDDTPPQSGPAAAAACKKQQTFFPPINGQTFGMWCEEMTASDLKEVGESVTEFKTYCEGIGSNGTFYSGGCPKDGAILLCRESNGYSQYLYGSEFTGVTSSQECSFL
jgi:hypothetical protein